MKAVRLTKIYLSFVAYMQTDRGKVYNMLSYDKRMRWDLSEDCYGRTVWGCAAVYASSLPLDLRLYAKEMVEGLIEGVDDLRYPRGIAFTLIGLSEYLTEERRVDLLEAMSRLAWKLVEMYESNSSGDWRWFEDSLTYENARLPQALFLAYKYTSEPRFLEVATESFKFLEATTVIDGVFWPIGNRGWYRRGGVRALYDQQPVEAGGMVEAALTGFEVTGEIGYLDTAEAAAEWYMGRNSKNVRVYDEATGGCFDGITVNGVNYNRGAEAALSYIIARLKLEELNLRAVSLVR